MLKVWFVDVNIKIKNIIIEKLVDGFFSMLKNGNMMFLIYVDLFVQK